jgi:hypothetical protein
MSFKFWISTICLASNLQTDAYASSSMASWASNMIISIASYNANTCGDSVNNISLFALGVNTRSTIYEVGLSRPLCKGGPTTLTVLLLVLGVGCPICCSNSILWGLITYPWTSISIPWCLGGQCGTWMLFHEHVNVSMNNFFKNIL